MTQGTYGLSGQQDSVRGFGGGLNGMSMQREGDAMGLARAAAQSETQLNIAQEQHERQRKAGNAQLGASAGALLGAQYGSAIAPGWGTLIGGVLGGLVGGAFSFLMAVVLVASLAFPQPSEAAMTIGLKPENSITQMDVHQFLSYDPETGIFTWINPSARRVSVGDRAGYKKKTAEEGGGYRYIKLGSKAYSEHRLAWLYMTGEWPPEQLDHRNLKRDDNRFENLRLATSKQNSENRKARNGSASQFRGVSWSGGKWCAVIMHFGKQVSLGSFHDIELAKAARLKAESEMFTHGRKVA